MASSDLGSAPRRIGGVWTTRSGRPLSAAGQKYWNLQLNAGATDDKGHYDHVQGDLLHKAQSAPTTAERLAAGKQLGAIHKAEQQQLQSQANAAMGMVPIAGLPFIAAEGKTAAQHGDIKGVGFAAAGLVPGWGGASRGLRLGLEAEKLAHEAGTASTVVRSTERAAADTRTIVTPGEAARNGIARQIKALDEERVAAGHPGGLSKTTYESERSTLVQRFEAAGGDASKLPSIHEPPRVANPLGGGGTFPTPQSAAQNSLARQIKALDDTHAAGGNLGGFSRDVYERERSALVQRYETAGGDTAKLPSMLDRPQAANPLAGGGRIPTPDVAGRNSIAREIKALDDAHAAAGSPRGISLTTYNRERGALVERYKTMGGDAANVTPEALSASAAEASRLKNLITSTKNQIASIQQKLAAAPGVSPTTTALKNQLAAARTRLDNLSTTQRALAIGGVTAASGAGGGYYLSTLGNDSKNVKVGGVAPTGINGTVKGTYTNPDTGVKTIYMSDGRVYSQAAGGNAYLAGHYNPATLGAPVNQPGFSVFQKAGAIAGQASSPGSSSSTSGFGIDHVRNPVDLRPTRHYATQLSDRIPNSTYGGQTGVIKNIFTDGTVTYVKDGQVLGREFPAGVPDTTGTAPRRPIPQSQYDVIAGSGPGASLSQHVAAIASQSNPSTAASQVMQLSESSQVRPTGWRTHTITDIHADHRVNGTGILTYGDGRSTVWRDGKIVGYVQDGGSGSEAHRPPDTMRTVDTPIPGSGGTGVGTTTPVADHGDAVHAQASTPAETEAQRRAKLAGLVAGNVVSHTTGANGNMLLHMANGNIVSVADDGKHFLAGRGTPATTPYTSRPPDVPGPAASGGGSPSNDNPTQPITPTPVSNPTSENSAGRDANYTNVATFTPNYGLGSNGADQKPDAGVTSLVSDPNSLHGGV